MTTEQYTRAIQISERLKVLEQVKKAISSTTRKEEIDQEIEALTKEIETL